jgi:hypothetical protein
MQLNAEETAEGPVADEGFATWILGKFTKYMCSFVTNNLPGSSPQKYCDPLLFNSSSIFSRIVTTSCKWKHYKS